MCLFHFITSNKKFMILVSLSASFFMSKHFILKNNISIGFGWKLDNTFRIIVCILHGTNTFSPIFPRTVFLCVRAVVYRKPFMSNILTRHGTLTQKKYYRCSQWRYMQVMVVSKDNDVHTACEDWRVCRTYNKSESKVWHTKCRRRKLKIDSPSTPAECQSQGKTAGRACAWIGARPWFAGWGLGVGGGGLQTFCLHLHQWKHLCRHSCIAKRFCCVPWSVNNFIVPRCTHKLLSRPMEGTQTPLFPFSKVWIIQSVFKCSLWFLVKINGSSTRFGKGAR